MVTYCNIVLILAIAALLNTRAANGEGNEFGQRLAKTMEECAGQYKTTQKDMLDAVMKPADFPKDAFKCAWACVFKKSELMDSNGMYVADAAIDNLKKYTKGPRMEEGIRSAKRCLSVNNQPVKDGTIGCDRAKLLVDCLVKDLLS